MSGIAPCIDTSGSESAHFSKFFEIIYKICILLHLWNPSRKKTPGKNKQKPSEKKMRKHRDFCTSPNLKKIVFF